MTLGPTEHCFVCGSANPRGLRLEFRLNASDSSLETEWVALAAYQGYDGILHGGILSTLLDEVVGKLSVELGKSAVTAEMTVRFLKPVKTGDRIRVRGRITGERRRILDAEAEALLEDGTLAATSTFVLVKGKS